MRRIQASTARCHDQIASSALVRGPPEIVHRQVTREHNAIQIHSDNPQVLRLRRYLLRILLRQVLKEIRSLDDPCVGKNKVESTVPLENSLKNRCQVAIARYIDFVKGRMRM